MSDRVATTGAYELFDPVIWLATITLLTTLCVWGPAGGPRPRRGWSRISSATGGGRSSPPEPHDPADVAQQTEVQRGLGCGQSVTDGLGKFGFLALLLSPVVRGGLYAVAAARLPGREDCLVFPQSRTSPAVGLSVEECSARRATLGAAVVTVPDFRLLGDSNTN